MRFVRLHRGNKNFAALIFTSGSELTKIAKINPLRKHATQTFVPAVSASLPVWM